MVTTVAVYMDTIVRDMAIITIGERAWKRRRVVRATVAARKQSAVLVVDANHAKRRESSVLSRGPIVTIVAASRDLNAKKLEWEITGANAEKRLCHRLKSLDLGSGHSLVTMLIDRSSKRYILNSLSWKLWYNINCFKQKGDNKTWQIKFCLICGQDVVQRTGQCIKYFLFLIVLNETGTNNICRRSRWKSWSNTIDNCCQCFFIFFIFIREQWPFRIHPKGNKPYEW